MWDYLNGLSQNLLSNLIWAVPTMWNLDRRAKKRHKQVLAHHDIVKKHLGIKEDK
jgi:uncharacterized membrane protein